MNKPLMQKFLIVFNKEPIGSDAQPVFFSGEYFAGETSGEFLREMSGRFVRGDFRWMGIIL